MATLTAARLAEMLVEDDDPQVLRARRLTSRRRRSTHAVVRRGRNHGRVIRNLDTETPRDGEHDQQTSGRGLAMLRGVRLRSIDSTAWGY